MPDPVTITVRGTPTPQGSKSGFAIKRGGQFTGQVAMVEGSGKSPEARQRMKNWRADVRQAAEDARTGAWDRSWPMDGPLAVTVSLVVPRPASAPKRRRVWPAKRPDLDKYLRSVFDSITSSGMWRDDAQVVHLVASKIYDGDPDAQLDTPGAVITIRQLT